MKDLIRDLLPWYSNNLEPEPRAQRPIRHQLFNSMSFDSPLKQHFLSDGANIYSPSTPSASSRRRLSLLDLSVMECCSASAVVSQHIKFC